VNLPGERYMGSITWALLLPL